MLGGGWSEWLVVGGVKDGGGGLWICVAEMDMKWLSHELGRPW